MSNTAFSLMKYLTLLKIAFYISESNNARYLVPLYSLINPSTLSNITCKGFAPNKVLNQTS